MKETIENHVKMYRTRVGWTQEYLAKKSGVSRQSIVSIEKGKYIPSLPLAFRFAYLFDCKVDDLFDVIMEE